MYHTAVTTEGYVRVAENKAVEYCKQRCVGVPTARIGPTCIAQLGAKIGRMKPKYRFNTLSVYSFLHLQRFVFGENHKFIIFVATSSLALCWNFHLLKILERTKCLKKAVDLEFSLACQLRCSHL